MGAVSEAAGRVAESHYSHRPASISNGRSPRSTSNASRRIRTGVTDLASDPGGAMPDELGHCAPTYK